MSELALKNSLDVRRLHREENKNFFLEIFEKSACNISVACKKLNISRTTFYQWREQDSSFAEEMHNLIEAEKDYAETTIKKFMREGNLTATIFFLKTQCKDRGYVERQEIIPAENQKLFEIEIIDGESKNPNE